MKKRESLEKMLDLIFFFREIEKRKEKRKQERREEKKAVKEIR